MAASSPTKTWSFLLLLLVLSSSLNLSSARMKTRTLSSLVKEVPLLLKYHNGPLLSGNLFLSLLWYGRFSSAQKSILLDFFHSLNMNRTRSSSKPTVSAWWNILQSYHSLLPQKPQASRSNPRVRIGKQTSDELCSRGKLLTRAQISQLADSERSGSRSRAGAAEIVVVFTAADVAVEGFCVGGCGTHGAVGPAVYVWVGNPARQCPGECAWPFHKPVYGPQTEPLVAPNGDVGADGMVMGVATAVAGAVTNPFRSGFFQGEAGAPLEAASACAGAYGSGAFPGYPGEILVDPTTGGSYNAEGTRGRKYLLPALWDPHTSKCVTLV